ncbi:MAG: PepSY domain-containing protein, partial [Cephaloticoccus sp.]|nr:PepSY domain-containing protein [Cephaloticoccus sp.]
LLRVRDAREATPGEKLRAILAPLHFGFYGATLTKWLYAIGGLVPGLLALSGTMIWWFRRRGSPHHSTPSLS